MIPLPDKIKAKLRRALARDYNIKNACKFAGIDRSVFYQHKRANPDFLIRPGYSETATIASRKEIAAFKAKRIKDMNS